MVCFPDSWYLDRYKWGPGAQYTRVQATGDNNVLFFVVISLAAASMICSLTIPLLYLLCVWVNLVHGSYIHMPTMSDTSVSSGCMWIKHTRSLCLVTAGTLKGTCLSTSFREILCACASCAPCPPSTEFSAQRPSKRSEPIQNKVRNGFNTLKKGVTMLSALGTHFCSKAPLPGRAIGSEVDLRVRTLAPTRRRPLPAP